MKKFDVLRNEVLGLKEELAKETVSIRSFNKFENKFKKVFEGLMFSFLTDNDKDKFYANFLLNSNRVLCYAIGHPLSHQVTNTTINLLINPLLLIEHSMEEMKVLLKHEVVHLISEHHARVDELESMYPRPICLLSADVVANAILTKEGEKLPEMMWTIETLNSRFNLGLEEKEYTMEELAKELNAKYISEIPNPDYDETLDEDDEDYVSEMMYEFSAFRLLITISSGGDKKNLEDKLKAELNGMAGFGSSIGQDEALFENDDACSFLMSMMADFQDASLIGDMLKHVVIDSVSKSRGLFPGGLAGLIKKLTTPPVISWQQEFAKFIGSIAAGKKKSIFRRNRRQPERLDLTGHLKDQELDLVVAIDTSGSMSDSIIAECMKEIFAMTKLMKAEITIIECDSRIQKVYKANDPSQVQVEVIGRGGTSFSPVFGWLTENKKKDSVLVFMSDGYGESKLDASVKNKHQGTIWLLTEKKADLSLKNGELPKRSKVLSLTNK